MPGSLLISTAYLPPVEYFSLMQDADEILVEREENYLKQTYRNRCYINSSNGPQPLSVPVFLGSIHKTPVKEIRIDYSKRWQQVHLRAVIASYRAAPFFEFYFEDIEHCILKDHEFLMDLNTELTVVIMGILGIKKTISYTHLFLPPGSAGNDFRYSISPKRKSDFDVREYTRVFNNGSGCSPRMSIMDLIFNMGPESVYYLAGENT